MSSSRPLPLQQYNNWLTRFKEDITLFQARDNFSIASTETTALLNEAGIITNIPFQDFQNAATRLGKLDQQQSEFNSYLQEFTETAYLALVQCCSESLELNHSDLVPILQYYLNELDLITTRMGYASELDLTDDKIRTSEYEKIMRDLKEKQAASMVITTESPKVSLLNTSSSLSSSSSRFFPSPKNSTKTENAEYVLLQDENPESKCCCRMM